MPKKLDIRDVETVLEKSGLYFYEDEIYKNSKSKLKLFDSEGYLYYTSIESLKFGYSPRKFSKHNPFTIENIKNYIDLSGVDVVLDSNHYENYDKKLIWVCKCGNKYECSLHHFIGANQYKCKECTTKIKSDKLRLDFDYVINEIEKYNYIPLFDTYINSDESLLCLDKNGYKVLVNYKRLKQGYKASPIHKSNPYTIYNIQKYLELHNIDCKIVSQKYSGNKSPLIFQCSCGDTYQTSWDSFIGNKVYRCGKCSKVKSSYEINVENWLIENKIKYTYQYSTPECRSIYPLPFDFYIHSHNTMIEIHGIQHYKPIELWGGVDELNQQQYRDRIKYDFCKNNGIKLLIIPYYEFNAKFEYINTLSKNFLGESS